MLTGIDDDDVLGAMLMIDNRFFSCHLNAWLQLRETLCVQAHVRLRYFVVQPTGMQPCGVCAWVCLLSGQQC